MNALLNYPGAKWGMAEEIVALMPPHRSYLEPFFGSGAVLFNKPPSAIETVNDIDGDIVNFFTILREQPEELARLIDLTPYARDVFDDAHHNRGNEPLDRAYRFAIRSKMGYGFKTYTQTGFKIDIAGRQGSYASRYWAKMPELVQQLGGRLKEVQIENRPALGLIRRFNFDNVLIYADPPYLLDTRGGKQYRHEMSEQDHVDLLAALLQHKGAVILSGYPSEMYDRELKGWSRITRKSYNQNADPRTEVLWCNFEIGQTSLFDSKGGSRMTEHIARISHGKDSLKMLDVIFTRNLPLDRITTTDVWATDTVRAELPPVLEAKARIEEKLWQMYRIEVEHLCARNKDGSKKTYEQMFYHVPVRKSGGVRKVGEINGFPVLTVPWCQSALKRNSKPQSAGNDYGIPSQHRIQLLPETQGLRTTQSRDSRCQRESPGVRNSNCEWKHPLSNERPTRREKRNIVEYLGIAADEPARFGQLNERKRAPLAEFGIEEGLCGLFCQYNDMLLPSYETSCRDGCWFCHNQGVNSLRNLWRNYPDHWALLLKWDKDSPVTFKADGHTVHDFDKRFRMEEEGYIDTHRPFRWAMLDNPPKFPAMNFEEISLFDRR